jgi:hypothetical protein
MDNVDEANSSHPSFALELHYYKSGLRYRLFARESGRPTWVPPSDYVGFADEFFLGSEDWALEIARFKFNGHNVNWFGIFEHSLDIKLGERRYHAGVGLWVRDRQIIYPRQLIQALRLISKNVAIADLATAERDAQGLIGGDFLYEYSTQIKELPKEISGFKRSEGIATETDIYAAVGGDENEQIESICDLIFRSQLIGTIERESRSLVYVPHDLRSVATGHPILKKSFNVEIVEAISIANSSSNAAVRDKLARADAIFSEQAALREECAQHLNKIGELKAQVDDLSERIDESHVPFQLKTISSKIDSLGDVIRDLPSSVRRHLEDFETKQSMRVGGGVQGWPVSQRSVPNYPQPQVHGTAQTNNFKARNRLYIDEASKDRRSGIWEGFGIWVIAVVLLIIVFALIVIGLNLAI